MKREYRRIVAFVGGGELKTNKEIPDTVYKSLSDRGHLVETVSSPTGYLVMIIIDNRTGLKHADGDLKANCHTASEK